MVPTYFAWYSFLVARKPDNVIFWHPSASMGLHALDNGEQHRIMTELDILQAEVRV